MTITVQAAKLIQEHAAAFAGAGDFAHYLERIIQIGEPYGEIRAIAVSEAWEEWERHNVVCGE